MRRALITSVTGHDRQNLAIQTSIIRSAWKYGTKKLMFLGPFCIDPRDCPQRIREKHLPTGSLAMAPPN